jgi:Cu-Zn family superoxide dismutase
MKRARWLLGGLFLLTFSLAAWAQAPTPPPAPSVTVAISDAKGTRLGDVRITETPHGLLIHGALTGVPPGEHAIHVHETGKCEPPFKTAGGHFNPGKKDHGALLPTGAHAGDLPNVFAAADGTLKFELLAPGVTLAARTASRHGSSVVRTPRRRRLPEPAGGRLGDRTPCGVLARPWQPRATNSCKCPNLADPWSLAPLNGLSVLPNRAPHGRDGRPGPLIEQQSLLAEWTWFAPAPRLARPSTPMPAGWWASPRPWPWSSSTAGGRALLPATCPPGRNAPAVTGSGTPAATSGCGRSVGGASLSPGAGAAGACRGRSACRARRAGSITEQQLLAAADCLAEKRRSRSSERGAEKRREQVQMQGAGGPFAAAYSGT